jgi:hypothetical protein
MPLLPVGISTNIRHDGTTSGRIHDT